VGLGLLIAKGYVKEIFKIIALVSFLNIGLSLILVKPLGILGVVLGTTVPMVLVFFPLILCQTLKVLKVSFLDFFDLAIKKNLGLYLLTIIISILVLGVFHPINIFFTLGEMGIVYVTVVLAGFYLFLSGQERKEILLMIKF
ncbi:MAG: hypothetical protein NTY04_01240, partial [Candidatus Staskawiczbacteria bacterium]|nr:hypothetical protein [Candidatus Staskawiczbacteria bacterium]